MRGSAGPGRGLLRRAGLVAATSVALLLPGLPSATAAVPGEVPQRTITYDVRVRGAVQTDAGDFARVAARTFHDRRGWSLGGSVRFTQVPSGGAFTLWLAAPSSMRSFSSVCSAQYSCRVGRNVIINDERWRTGTASWPAVREYRQYVLNHELGHWLGLGHVSCSGPGAPASVMQQQSKGLGGCRSATWPLEQERRAAAAGARVALRGKAPAVTVVKRSGRTGTEAHVLDGTRAYAAWLSHTSTSLPATDQPSWTFRTADHDVDGVDDLYAIEHRSGATVRVHVRDGASGYRTSLLDTATPLQVLDGSTWTFAVDDQDGDGVDDVYAIDGQGRTGTEVHVLDGASGFRAWRLHAATALHRTDAAGWSMSVGDHDRDGVPDLYAVLHRGASGRTEAHVLSGAAGFRRWIAHAATPLGPSDPVTRSFEVADVDGDGYDDVVVLDRAGASGRTEVHALDRTSSRWLLHAATAREPTPGRTAWSFDLS